MTKQSLRLSQTVFTRKMTPITHFRRMYTCVAKVTLSRGAKRRSICDQSSNQSSFLKHIVHHMPRGQCRTGTQSHSSKIFRESFDLIVLYDIYIFKISRTGKKCRYTVGTVGRYNIQAGARDNLNDYYGAAAYVTKRKERISHSTKTDFDEA